MQITIPLVGFTRLSRSGSTGVLAFTLIEIMIVVGILGLLMSITIPYYVRQRAITQSNICINNITKIDDAACQFALERGKKTGDSLAYPSDLTPYIHLNQLTSLPSCPAGGLYSVASVGSHPTCSLNTTVSPSHIMP